MTASREALLMSLNIDQNVDLFENIKISMKNKIGGRKTLDLIFLFLYQNYQVRWNITQKLW